MTAGRGIVHSERSGAEERARDKRLHGMQSWVALPLAEEKAAPSFAHHGAAELPVIERDGLWMRLIAGQAYGERAPANFIAPWAEKVAQESGGRIAFEIGRAHV